MCVFLCKCSIFQNNASLDTSGQDSNNSLNYFVNSKLCQNWSRSSMPLLTESFSSASASTETAFASSLKADLPSARRTGRMISCLFGDPWPKGSCFFRVYCFSFLCPGASLPLHCKRVSGKINILFQLFSLRLGICFCHYLDIYSTKPLLATADRKIQFATFTLQCRWCIAYFGIALKAIKIRYSHYTPGQIQNLIWNGSNTIEPLLSL